MAAGGRVRVSLIVLAVLLVLLAGLHRVALQDLREIEADYVASRKPTACAIRRLEPVATNPDMQLEDLHAAVADAVEAAALEVAEVRKRFEARGGTVAHPSVRSARAALDEALREQVELYETMINDPAKSQAAFERFGPINGRAEREISSGRRWLLVPSGAGWSDRFKCDQREDRT